MSLYLDPSVLVSMVLADAGSTRARAFVEECRQPVFLSDFGLLEVASAFGRLVRMKLLRAEDARRGVTDLRTWAARAATDTALQTSDLAFAEAALNGFKLNLKASDALHIAVAHRLRATLATLDGRQAANARALGVVAVEP